MKRKYLFWAIIVMFVAIGSAMAGVKKTSNKTVTLNVSLHCQSCVNTIERNISFEKGVKDLNVNLDKKTVTITFDTLKTNTATLTKKIIELGYEASEKK